MRNIYSLLAGATGLTMTVSACGEKPAGAQSASTAAEATTSSADAGAEAASPPADTAAETAPVTADTTIDQPAADRPATGLVPDDRGIKPATQADVQVGAAVSDSAGVSFGKVEAVDAQGVTVSSGAIRAKLPLSSVGVGPNGLVISVTKAEFEAAARAAQ